jgi:hypothetical protein
MKKIKIMNKVKHGFIKQSLLLTFIMLLFLGVDASQATKNPEQQPTKSNQTKPEKSNEQQQDKSKLSKDAVKVFVKQIQIYGKVAKPQAIFFYKSGDPKVDGLKINRHFFDHIFREVEKSSVKRVRKTPSTKRNHIEW